MVFIGGCAVSLARRVLSQYQSQHLSRVSDLRPYDLTRRLLSTKSYTSAASAKHTASRSKGFVIWYLGMIESRPVLTKSITASLIFTVADLSSQVCARFTTHFLPVPRLIAISLGFRYADWVQSNQADDSILTLIWKQCKYCVKPLIICSSINLFISSPTVHFFRQSPSNHPIHLI